MRKNRDFKFLKNLKNKKIKRCKKCKKLFLSEKSLKGAHYKLRCLACSEYDKYELRKKVFNDERNLIDLRVSSRKE